MPYRGTLLSIRVTHIPNIVTAISVLRAATAAPINQIRTAVIQKLPQGIGILFGRDHDEVESRALKLIHDLDQLGAAFEILLDDRVESRSYFNNRLQSRRLSLVLDQARRFRTRVLLS